MGRGSEPVKEGGMGWILEVCVDSAEGLAAALSGGADRIELCAALELGGLTPPAGLVAEAAGAGVPVHAMIRTRPGDFVYSEAEVRAMQAEIAAMRAAGLGGVVIGASLPDGRLDLAALGRLCAAAEGLDRTLHRAVDLTPDPEEAVEQAAGLGFDRILTSGGAVRVVDGLGRLERMHRAAAGRLAVMPGSGITPQTLHPVLQRVPAREIHASCAGTVPQSPAAIRLNFAGPERRETDSARVRALRAAMTDLA